MHRHDYQLLCAIALLAAATLGQPVAAAQPRSSGEFELPAVDVVGLAPLHGPGTPAQQLPGQVQSATAATLREERALTVADFMNRRFGGVSINEAQGNPFQPDVGYRGFVASPLLGNPIGLSVFVDGVRVNESLGDIVLWDLIPTFAVSNITLQTVSNPVFGLNTLGGALAVRLKSGRQNPGVDAELLVGSFGRRSSTASAGGTRGNFDGFIGAAAIDDAGWRDRSPSRLRQFFARTGWESAVGGIDLSYTRVGNRLAGNGLVPEPLLAERRQNIYTYPDVTEPQLDFLNLTGSRFFGRNWVLTGNLYRRALQLAGLNGDAEFDDADTPLDVSDDEYEAEIRYSGTDQRMQGAAAQLAYTGTLLGRQSRATVGASLDRGQAHFTQQEQAAAFTADRGVEADGEPEFVTSVATTNRYTGWYFIEQLTLHPALRVVFSARYNQAHVELSDRSGAAPELNGRHRFQRLSKALGAVYAPTPALGLYANYSEGYRVPSPVELSCADPAAPCSLPVSFAADPPLLAVTAQLVEVGARGQNRALDWNISAYLTELQNDIVFSAIGGSRGFFINVPHTRRQGIEAALGRSGPRFRWQLDYSLTDAIFHSPAELFNAVAHPADPGQPASIGVHDGNRVPGLPRHQLKFHGGLQLSPTLQLAIASRYSAAQYFRGDEHNVQPPLGGYTLMELRLEQRLASGWGWFLKVDNLLNRRYATLGAFNRVAFDASNTPLAGVGPGPVQRFVAPGAPRGLWIGFQYRNR